MRAWHSTSVIALTQSAFLASVASTSESQARILLTPATSHENPACDQTKQNWMAKSNEACPTDIRQRAPDKVMVDVEYRALLSRQIEPFHRARLLAASSERSGDWLYALPISSCGLRLDNEEVRIAAGLRLGCAPCQPHRCPCGAIWWMHAALMDRPVDHHVITSSTTCCGDPSCAQE
jgi:hypothetical protein